MSRITPVDRPIFWLAREAGQIVASGVTPVGAETLTRSSDVISADSENAFLGAVAGQAGGYNPLPDVGEWVEAGIYSYGDDLLIARKPHVRPAGDPTDISLASLYGVYRPGEDVWEWVSGEVVYEGALRSWEGVTYELYRDIGANNFAPPPDNLAHWRIPSGGEIGEWVSGEALTYDPDNPIYRTYEGVTYKLIQNPGINIWPPPTVPALWELVEA